MEETKHFDGGAAMTSEDLAAGAGPVLRFFARQLLAFVKDWQGVPAEFEFKSFKIGKDFIAVSFPGEPFTQIGMAVKAESCARYNFMVTLAMGEAGYICIRAAGMKSCRFPRQEWHTMPQIFLLRLEKNC